MARLRIVQTQRESFDSAGRAFYIQLNQIRAAVPNLATRRFNELHGLRPDISHKVLTETLRNLEGEGLISRTVYPEVPSRVEYCISTHGESVIPILQAVRSWGHEQIAWKRQAADKTEDSERGD